jgi:hypothetical protein
MNKTLLKIALVVALAAIVAAGFYYYNANTEPQTEGEQEFMVEKTELSESELPSGFPENLPEENGVEVLENYEAVTEDGRTQSTRVMTTERTSAQAAKVYSDFFAKLGWNEISNEDNGDVVILMKNGDNTLLIEAREGADQSTVSLTLTEAR